jgi:hypothetical protein
MPDKHNPTGGSSHVNGHGTGPADDHEHVGEEADLVVELDQDEQDQITVALADSLGTLMREYVRGECSYEELTIEVFATLQALISVREGELPLEWLDLLNTNGEDGEDSEVPGPNGDGNHRDDDGLLWLRGKPGE